MTQNNNTMTIEVDNLKVKSERDALLLDVSKLVIKPGSKVAIVGPNGSGKTTLLETLVGLRKYSSSQKLNMMMGAKRKDLGCQLQNSTYNNEFKVCDILDLHKKLYQKTDLEFYKALDLSSLEKKQYKILSRGEKQRVDLYVALAHRPKLIFLDEPTTGLDRVYLEAVMKRLLEETQDNTLLMASHTAKEVAITDFVLWMNQGKMVTYQPKKDFLQNRLGSHRVDLYFDRLAPKLDELFSRDSSGPEINLSLLIEENHLQLFGQEPLRRWILEKSQTLALVEFAVAKTSEADLLRYTAWSKPNEEKGEQK